MVGLRKGKPGKAPWHPESVRRVFLLILLLALPALIFAQGKNNQTNERSVSGVVTDGSGAPIKGAIVQLENTKTLQIRSFIAKDDGTYFFNGLGTDTDYQLTAQIGGNRSSTKTLSSFDSRKNATMNLEIKMK